MENFLARYRMTNFGPRNGLEPSWFYKQRSEPDEPVPSPGT
jgi:hypothetical protein